MLILALAMAGSTQAQDNALDLPLRRQADAALVRVIAQVGRPDKITLRSGQSFTDAVRERCGVVDPTYVKMFLEENKGGEQPVTPDDLLALAADKAFLYPACVRQPTFETYVVKSGESVGSIYAARNMPLDAIGLEQRWSELRDIDPLPRLVPILKAGAPDARQISGFLATENARLFIRANESRTTPQGLDAKDEIKVPKAEAWTTLVVRPGISQSWAKDQINKVLPIGERRAGRLVKAEVASLIDAMALPADACPTQADDWPYAIADLKAAIADDKAARYANIVDQPTTIMMLDTGSDDFDQWRATFGEGSLGKILPLRVLSSDRKVHGVNLAASIDNPLAPKDLPQRLHGIEVASVILAAGLSDEDRAKLTWPLNVVFASIAVEDTDGSIFLSAKYIPAALAEAKKNKIPIINASLMAVQDRKLFADAVAKFPEVLFVTAAGNDGGIFGKDDFTWPGGYGGDPKWSKGLVVTVGSYDQKRQPFYFTRGGQDRVDVLAPGCRVRVMTRGDASLVNAERAGTSFSASYVAMLSGLLSAGGLAPQHIKILILIGTDVDNALDGVVYSRGRVNLRKLLSARRDVLEYRLGDGLDAPKALVTGEVADRNVVWSVCTKSFALGELLKLAVAGPDGGRQIHLWTSSASEADEEPQLLLRQPLCPAIGPTGSEATLSFKVAGIKDRIEVPLSRIEDLVMRTLNP